MSSGANGANIKTINMAAHMRLGIRQLLQAKNTAHFRFEPAVVLYKRTYNFDKATCYKLKFSYFDICWDKLDNLLY